MFRTFLVMSVAATGVAWGQTERRAILSVTVVDSADVPVASANLTVMRGISERVSEATTDASGRARLSAPSGTTIQIVAKKIGYQPNYRFFATGQSDTADILVRLSRTVVALETVRISAPESQKRKSYYLDADDLANSSRPIIDGTDLFKLRPQMINSRGGVQACTCMSCIASPMYLPPDGWIESVWINGTRAGFGVLIDTTIANGFRSRLNVPRSPPSRGQSSFQETRRPPPTRALPRLDTVLTVLRSVQPEHIQEVQYRDCFDPVVASSNSTMAMFIILKPNIGYADGKGTYVIDEKTAAGAPLDVRDFPPYRFRVLGVFDAVSGAAITDVEVKDSVSGNTSRTSSTGTVALFFLPEGPSVVQLRHAAYRDTTLTVSIAPGDTIPITVTLAPRPR